MSEATDLGRHGLSAVPGNAGESCRNCGHPDAWHDHEVHSCVAAGCMCRGTEEKCADCGCKLGHHRGDRCYGFQVGSAPKCFCREFVARGVGDNTE